MDMRFLRRWHRWVGWTAAIFLLWAACTGVLVAYDEFFGADEALREQLRDIVSPVTVNSPDTAWTAAIARAMATASKTAPGAPIDKIDVALKGKDPLVSVFLGKPTGGEDKLLKINARTGELVSEEAYADKPLLYRLHSGEALGDGGLVGSMLWGLALIAMTLTGGLMYIHMYRKHHENQHATGWRKFFW